MKHLASRTSVFLAAAALVACQAPSSGQLPFEEGAASSVGKADHLDLELTRLNAPISTDRKVQGGKAIITSAASWEDYMGTTAPADVDFDREWIAFYGAGTRNTGGYSATISSLLNVPSVELLVLETEHKSPGFDCIVTQAITWPHDLVKFEIPNTVPTWATSEHHDETYLCSPSPDEHLADLLESQSVFEELKAEHDNSYKYTRENHSFFANISTRTIFLVEEGDVVERAFKQQIGEGEGSSTTTWMETGAEVGSHTGAHRVATLDDLYAECADEVLTKDPSENFINLSFSPEGLLQVCTYRPIHCADDCTFGPVITDVLF